MDLNFKNVRHTFQILNLNYTVMNSFVLVNQKHRIAVKCIEVFDLNGMKSEKKNLRDTNSFTLEFL